jgi:NAD(P)-dependent dehydrogenase (short-subunit alcohol dehydrogenase family)
MDEVSTGRARWIRCNEVDVDLDGLRVLIFGGTSGIGARTAELLAESRSRVVIAGRRQHEGEELASRLGARAACVRCDVTVESDVAGAVSYAVARFGGLDALVNSAGGGVPEPRGIASADPATTEATLRLHLVGVIAAMKHAAPVMVDQRSGSIVNVASLGGLRAGWSTLGYSAAKAALIHLTRCVAVELGEFGVRVNSVSPGPTLTGIFGKSAGLEPREADDRAGELGALFESLVRPWQPFPRMAAADDVARVVVWLAGNGSSFVNGQDLVVDGGISAGRPLSASDGQRERINAALAAVSSLEAVPREPAIKTSRRNLT